MVMRRTVPSGPCFRNESKTFCTIQRSWVVWEFITLSPNCQDSFPSRFRICLAWIILCNSKHSGDERTGVTTGTRGEKACGIIVNYLNKFNADPSVLPRCTVVAHGNACLQINQFCFDHAVNTKNLIKNFFIDGVIHGNKGHLFPGFLS